MRRVCCALVIASIWAVAMTQEHGISLDAADSEVAGGPVPASIALVQTEATSAKKMKPKKKGKTKPQKLKTVKNPKQVKKSKFIKRPSGTFPTKEKKSKVAKIERQYLARKKVMADKKEKKWQKQVLQVKVDRMATKIMKSNKKKIQKHLVKDAKRKNVRKKGYKAKEKAKREKLEAESDAEKGTYQVERRHKADHAIKHAAKVVERLKDLPGKEAARDQKTAYALLAKLRVAKAHASGEIAGLSKRQQGRPCLVAIHEAVKLAAGEPNKHNIAHAKRLLKKSADCEQKERRKKILMAKQKAAKERALKKKREAKKKEIWSRVEMPTKYRKEKKWKDKQAEIRLKWLAKQEVKTKELGKKAEKRTK